MDEVRVPKRKRPLFQQCPHCNTARAGEEFIWSKSSLFFNHLVPICNICIKERMKAIEWNWVGIDKLCQFIDIPFIPAEFERLHEINGDDVFPIYAKMLNDQPFEELGWADYYERFKELKELDLIDNELPQIHEAKVKQLQEEWGPNYDEESLSYLEALFRGMLSSQNISGALQFDQARKLCKISLTIDKKIRAGDPIDKDMSSYDKMVKTAELTPKNTKTDNDFDSFGEAMAWLEKRGFLNTYFDDVSRDVVDEVIQNMQNFNQRLYTGESGIADQIQSRIESLRLANTLEAPQPLYDLTENYDLERYDNDTYNQLIKEELILDDDDISHSPKKY